MKAILLGVMASQRAQFTSVLIVCPCSMIKPGPFEPSSDYNKLIKKLIISTHSNIFPKMIIIPNKRNTIFSPIVKFSSKGYILFCFYEHWVSYVILGKIFIKLLGFGYLNIYLRKFITIKNQPNLSITNFFSFCGQTN